MIGILLSSFERYERIAHFTERQIKKYWVAHPPLFFSGLLRDEECYLNFKSDSRNWMGVTLEAVQEMRYRGFTHVYLILDDHPPVGACDDVFLNESLPALAVKLDAVTIGLLGYGQHRAPHGVILEKENGFLEKCSSTDPWKFSLHPGLWKLEALQLILEQRLYQYGEGKRTAWNFERHQDQLEDPILKPLLHRCFRISGEHFLKEPKKMKFEIIKEAIERFGVDVMLYLAKKGGGVSARLELEKKELWRYGHYLGPYPIFWSGLMQQGRPHQGFEKWLSSCGNRELQEEWKKLKFLLEPNSSLNPDIS
ncbi:MAG: hypothetical protein K9M81_01775 [Chthoniobacterales bacterium]|nr:hypothetical protein [Chthoniobacterales bacterium]